MTLNTVAREPRGGRRGAIGGTRIAAIDIGSNSIRQVIADVSPDGTIHVLDEMKAAPRLGAGLEETGVLSEESIAAAIIALQQMAALAKRLDVARLEAVATSAVRDAANGAFFVTRVRQETGLKLSILSGDEEARLSFLSAAAHFELGSTRTAVVDIGGGSLEVTLSVGGIVDRLVSLPLGAVRLTDRFFSAGVTPIALRALRRDVRSSLRKAMPAREWRGVQIIGSGGTFTNLAGVALHRQGLGVANSVHGTPVTRAEVEHILDTLAELPLEERRLLPGLNPGRADIIVAGIAVVAELLARLEAHEVVVSRYGIREGILLRAAQVVPTVSDPGEARARAVRDFASRCRVEWGHAEHVRALSLQLFDALGPRLGCDPADRLTLADAALLHDTGYHISYDRHHKHSYHLIVHAELLGISPLEQVVIAHVARYHRGARPKSRHPGFGDLDRSVRDRIERLAAILRIADGLDRGHNSAVKQVRVRWLGRAIRITAIARDGRHALRLELWGAHHKSDLLERVAGLPIEIVGPDKSVLSSAGLDESD